MMAGDNWIDTFDNQDDKLEEALALLAAGYTLDEVLAEAGTDETWLRPLLAAAGDVRQVAESLPLPAPQASLDRLLAYAATQQTTASALESWLSRLSRLFNLGRLPRLAVSLAAMVLVILLGGTAVLAAQSSLPDQPLYPIKRAGETLRLNLTQDPAVRQELMQHYNRLRQTEIEELLQGGRSAEISFVGEVEQVTGSVITVAGFTADISAVTEAGGQVAPGAQVRLIGLTQPPDRLLVRSIVVLEPAPSPTPTATATPTTTPSPTATPSPTSTATVTPVPTSTATATAPPTATPIPTITPLPTQPPPAPTATVEVTNEADDDNSGPGSSDDNSGPGGGDDNSGSGSDDDNSGSGRDDHSGSGGGDDNSGSGSDDDNSGSGGGDDNSGSGSSDDHSGSGGGGKDDD